MRAAVLTVSDDAVPIEKVGLVYPTRVSMDRSTIQVEGKPVNLSPGMAVTVEIKTREDLYDLPLGENKPLE